MDGDDLGVLSAYLDYRPAPGPHHEGAPVVGDDLRSLDVRSHHGSDEVSARAGHPDAADPVVPVGQTIDEAGSGRSDGARIRLMVAVSEVATGVSPPARAIKSLRVSPGFSS